MTRGRWLAPLRPGESAPFRLYCFPAEAAGPAMFHDLAQRLPDDIEPVGIRAPGRESRWAEPPFTDATAMVDAMAGAVGGELVSPFGLFGYCTGSLVVFDLARRLQARGLPGPRVVFVLSHGTPESRPKVHVPPGLDPIDRLLRMGGTIGSAARHPELLRIVRRMVEADFAMFDDYRFVPGEPLTAPISVLGGRDDPVVTLATLAGWHAHTTGDLTMRVIDGNHLLLQTNPEGVVDASVDDVRRVLCRGVPAVSS